MTDPKRDSYDAILNPVREALDPLHPDASYFWQELVGRPPQTTTVRSLAIRLDVSPYTLVSRFARAGLPSPKSYLVAVRLCHAAQLFDEGDRTVQSVAHRLAYSSASRFGHHLRRVLGINPTEFRARVPFNLQRDRLLDQLVRPYVDQWREFRPLDGGRRHDRRRTIHHGGTEWLTR